LTHLLYKSYGGYVIILGGGSVSSQRNFQCNE